ncbi:putative transcription factor & lipid binding HD-SAD family [Helianthus annuus]|uniref:Putative HD-ZIP IV family of homeobox-leucine zipper protein n=1 Tax=Helianthus annuus TaxID=4232 RepID=A0A251U082_HELAN|nr:homeobox-leucine zipper protein GLABRA 2 [Helianthus annuus]KAF5793267.1 putative transcription factor & lipid binding HD-SAD family [Helianthus annuus]KAJ0528104.1 putative transcription factor & lipid binding HD-SAD family [Helianthus annuus]KAJ0536981.1 putative transcription factor & lipid binding HD-SAD family [Helianthus annuus]KAJ0544539.1 putative transcription factor & lipid binding HD-SAD family [Helianthus annuus]KAJ0895540.1 putative transcription factor & lipid binding HD-SAD f
MSSSNDNNNNFINNPLTSTKDLFPSTSLSLTLGLFRDGEDAVDDRKEEAANTTVTEISSETSGPVRSRSDDDDFDADPDVDDGDDASNKNNKSKKRKKYHRHTADQIREMEALFKESPHPDEKQRQQLSKRLGLHPRQVKFWFQNRRTQIKTIQERHENSLLKSELDKLGEENKLLRETIKKGTCTNCGFGSSSKDVTTYVDEQQLRVENAKLRAEIEKLRTSVGKYPQGASPTNSCSVGNDHENKSSLDLCSGLFGLEKSRVMEVVDLAVEELVQMASAGEPLWVKSLETGREILNYDEYLTKFSTVDSSNVQRLRFIEASRDSGVVFVDLPQLVRSFMDVKEFEEMFPCMISKAATLDVICNGEGPNRKGAVQLMFAELQMLTPLVATREVYFVRYSKQLTAEKWAIVDVSIDNVEKNIDASLARCRKRPSGCIIEDKSNGHCKVTWIEHWECQKSVSHSMFRAIINSGLAFGARHWMATLQQQCERLVFFLATNVPTKDSCGIGTLAGRKSILKLAQRMTSSFSRALGASSYHTWKKIPSKTGYDIRVASRKNLNDAGEPLGVILCAVSSIWLPVSHTLLFDFLRDETRRNEWDIMSNGGPVQSIANLAKGQDQGNTVSIHTMKWKENMWMIQDSCTNAYESMVVCAPVAVTAMQSIMAGCDSSNIAILPLGFSILPDGIETRPLVITSKADDQSWEYGSLLTVGFQILTSDSPISKLSMESVDSVNTLISSTLHNIKTGLQCEDQ